MTQYHQNTCAYCGDTFGHQDASVDVCRTCYYSGKSLEKEYASILTIFRQVNANTTPYHTGGGCWSILIPVDEPTPGEWFKRYVLISDAEDPASLPEDDGMSESQRWVVAFYDDNVDLEGAQLDFVESATTQEALEFCIAWDAVERIREDRRDDPRLAAWDGTDYWTLHDFVDANEYVESVLEISEAQGYETIPMFHRVQDKVAAILRGEIKNEEAQAQGS